MYIYSWGDPVNLRQPKDDYRLRIYSGTQRGARATEFSMVAFNIRGPSSSKLLHVTLLAFRNLRWLLRFFENLWTPLYIQLPFLQSY